MEILEMENLGYNYKQINILMQISKENLVSNQSLFNSLKPETPYTKYRFCKDLFLSDKLSDDAKKIIFYNIEDKYDFEKINFQRINNYNAEAVITCLELNFFPEELYTSRSEKHFLTNEIEGLYHGIKIDDYDLYNSNNICYLIVLKDAGFDLNLLKKNNVEGNIDTKIKVMCEEELYDERLLDERCNHKNIDLVLYCLQNNINPKFVYRHGEDGQELLSKTLDEFGELFDLIENDWTDQILDHIITIRKENIEVDEKLIIDFEKSHNKIDNEVIFDILWTLSGYPEGVVKKDDIKYILNHYENFLMDKKVFSDLMFCSDLIKLDNITFKELIRIDPMERRDMVEIYMKQELGDFEL